MPRPKRARSTVGPGDERQLVLAAVARAAVDVADGERTGACRGGQADVAAERPEIAEQSQHQRSTQA